MRKNNILIVDDDPNIRKLLGDLLSPREDYHLLMAADGVEAMNYLTTERVDVVFTDIHMPGFTGLELMADIQKIGIKPEILVMTANGTEENVETARTIGARSLILKPFDNLDVVEGEIEKAVQAAVDNQPQNGNGHRPSAEPVDGSSTVRIDMPPEQLQEPVVTPAEAVPASQEPSPPPIEVNAPPEHTPAERMEEMEKQAAKAGGTEDPPAPPEIDLSPPEKTVPDVAVPSEPPVVVPEAEPEPEPSVIEGNGPSPPIEATPEPVVETPKPVAKAKPSPTPSVKKTVPEKKPIEETRPDYTKTGSWKVDIPSVGPRGPEPISREIPLSRMARKPEKAAKPHLPAGTGEGIKSAGPSATGWVTQLPADLVGISQMADQMAAGKVQVQIPIIGLRTWEETEALEALRKVSSMGKRKFFTWSAARGLVDEKGKVQRRAYRDPIRALEFLRAMKEKSMGVFLDFRTYLEQPPVARLLREMVVGMELGRSLVVLVGPHLAPPPELQEASAVLDWPPNGGANAWVLDRIKEQVESSTGRWMHLDDDTREALVDRVKDMPAGRARFEIIRALLGSPSRN